MKPRTLVDHKSNGLNEAIDISVLDEPGHGGACHIYQMKLDPEGFCEPVGPVKEAGVNGISQEALLAILIDRLRSFQSGPYACRENALALTHCEEALMWLQKRTLDRLRRGVYGTNVK